MGAARRRRRERLRALYVVPRDKKAQIAKLKGLLKDADELYLATDEDREGEAIAWHLLDELKPKVPVHRMVFHEITKPAIMAAVDNPRDIDKDLVEAQEARRILDRLYGYEVSPGAVEEGHVRPVRRPRAVRRHPAGRRPRARADGVPARVLLGPRGHLRRRQPSTSSGCSRPRLYSVDGARVARGSDFGQDGQLKASAEGKVVHLDRTARRGPGRRPARTRRTTSARSRPSPTAARRTRRSAPPRSSRRRPASSGFSASMTMSVAQRLYENGFITYMRTDSTTLSSAAVGAARSQVRELYGAEYVPDAPRVYTSKVKNAQEAHEAIRPAGDSFRTPGADRPDRRRVPALRADLDAHRRLADEGRRRQHGDDPDRWRAPSTGEDVVFSASGRDDHLPRLPQGVRRGHRRRVGRQGRRRDPAARARRRATPSPRRRCPRPATRPSRPSRYTEATLIKELEDREIGRPSTYASIIKTILDRGYVYKKGTALVPAWLAFSVTRLLEEHFDRLVSYEFTAGMEDVLDEIAAGRKDRATELGEFYYGSDEVKGLHGLVDRSRRHRRQGAGDVPGRRRRQRHRAAGRPLRPLPRGPGRRGQPRRQAGQRARGPAARRADPREGQGAVRQPGRRGDRARRPPGHRAAGRGEERPLRPLRHRGAARGRRRSPRSRAPARCSRRWRWTRSRLEDARQAAHPARAWSAPTPRAWRSPRRTAATARTSRRAPTPGR